MTAAHQENAGEAAHQPTWRDRVKAWWNGSYLQSANSEADAEETEGGAQKASPAEPTVKSWSPERLKAVQDIFGSGFNLPGGDELNHRVFMPAALDSNKSAVEFCAGLGAMTRAMASRLGLWMTSYESDPLLVARANAIADSLDLEKRASLKCQTLDKVEMRERGVDAVLAREGLYLWPDKATLFAKVRKALRPNGCFSFIDYFGEVTPGNRIMEAWAGTEPKPPHLLTIEAAKALLQKLGFEVRVTEDLTQTYKSTVLHDFARYADEVKEHKIPIEQREWAINEGEHWAIRVAAMESGGLKVFRILAVAPAEARR